MKPAANQGTSAQVETPQNASERFRPWPDHVSFPECLPERIRDRIVPCPVTGCWLWTGAISEKGYALVWWRGAKRRLHRVVFELVHGRPPRRDRELLHKCDTRPCCYITRDASTHLREGTTRQNARDRQNKGRTRGCCGRIAA